MQSPISSPIKSRVKALFVHVNDLEKSIAYYSKVLGQPIRPEKHFGVLYMFDLQDGLQLILDSNVNNPKEELRPSAMFDTDDIEAADKYLRENGVEVISEIQRFPDVCFFHFRDPDGNVSMVCQELK